MKVKNKIKLKSEHEKTIGHTTSIRRPGYEKILGEGILSLENDETKRIRNSVQNGYPFEASMGLDAFPKHFETVPSGKIVIVNNKQFTGPIVVMRNTILEEMTICE